MDTSLDIRRIVLENLVLAKQLLQQPINIKTILNEALHEVHIHVYMYMFVEIYQYTLYRMIY